MIIPIRSHHDSNHPHQEPCRREELSGSLSGSLNGLSNKPCLNRFTQLKVKSANPVIFLVKSIERV